MIFAFNLNYTVGLLIFSNWLFSIYHYNFITKNNVSKIMGHWTKYKNIIIYFIKLIRAKVSVTLSIEGGINKICDINVKTVTQNRSLLLLCFINGLIYEQIILMIIHKILNSNFNFYKYVNYFLRMHSIHSFKRYNTLEININTFKMICFIFMYLVLISTKKTHIN